MIDRHTPIRNVMTEEVLTVGPETIMSDVAEMFDKGSVHHIPVVKDDKVVGIISTSDFYKLEHHFTLFKTHQADEMNAAIFRSLLAKEVMKSPVATVRTSDSVQFAADIFKENLFHALPVVDEQKNIVGIITPFDLMVFAYGPEHLAELAR